MDKCSDCSVKLLTNVSILYGECFYCRNKNKIMATREKKWVEEFNMIPMIVNNDLELRMTRIDKLKLRSVQIMYGRSEG